MLQPLPILLVPALSLTLSSPTHSGSAATLWITCTAVVEGLRNDSGDALGGFLIIYDTFYDRTAASHVAEPVMSHQKG